MLIDDVRELERAFKEFKKAVFEALKIPQLAEWLPPLLPGTTEQTKPDSSTHRD